MKCLSKPPILQLSPNPEKALLQLLELALADFHHKKQPRGRGCIFEFLQVLPLRLRAVFRRG